MAQKKTGEIGRALASPTPFIEENLYFSISEQCRWYELSRNSYYYTPRINDNSEDEYLKKKILAEYAKDVTAGSRRISAELNKVEVETGRKQVMRLMRELNIQGVCPKKNLSMPKEGAQKFDYLLKDLDIDRPNQVWSTDITYICTPYGHLYLTAIIDVYSRYIVSWELSNSLSKEFCLSTLDKALRLEKPEIINTDQGSQYTSKEYISKVTDSGIKLSMDGKGRCLDNVWIERFWRTIKYSEIYLNEYKDVHDLYLGINKYIEFYNTRRGHSSLGYETPADVYFSSGKSNIKIA